MWKILSFRTYTRDKKLNFKEVKLKNTNVASLKSAVLYKFHYVTTQTVAKHTSHCKQVDKQNKKYITIYINNFQQQTQPQYNILLAQPLRIQIR